MPIFNASQFNSALFGGAGGLPPGFAVHAVGQSILYPALRKAQITLGPGRTPSLAQFQDAIDELNRLIGSLNCDRLNIYSVVSQQFPLDPPKASYTIGLSPDGSFTADFPVERPQGIESANIISGGDAPIRYPLALATASQWSAITFQSLANSIPTTLYNDRGYPISTLYFYGQPAPGQVLELFTWTLVPSFQTITDVVLLPPGYEDALVLNLAVRLAPHFQKGGVPPDVREDAQKALMRIESINAPRPIADTTSALHCNCNDFNIFSGR